MIEIESRETFLKCKAISFKDIIRNSRDAQEVYIRSQYDCAKTDAIAVAAIEVADLLGFGTLSDKMAEDFFNKTGRTV